MKWVDDICFLLKTPFSLYICLYQVVHSSDMVKIVHVRYTKKQSLLGYKTFQGLSKLVFHSRGQIL